MDKRPPSPPGSVVVVFLLIPTGDTVEANGSEEERAATEASLVVVKGESNKSGWENEVGAGAWTGAEVGWEANGSLFSGLPVRNGLSLRSGTFLAGKGGGTGAAPGRTTNPEDGIC